MADILVRTIDLACPLEHAFDVFIGKIDFWWPRGHRKTTDATLAFDGERLVEQASDGSEWTMARVVKIDRPYLLSLDRFPGSPAAPTAVEIRFAATGVGTTITVTHRALSAGAEAVWPQRVALFARGWDTVLPALKTFIEED